MRRAVLLILFLFITATTSMAQVKVGQDGTISGLAFNDYYWVVSNHRESLEGSNGFRFRRIYLGYTHRYNDSFSGRLRLEMNSEGNYQTGGRMTPFVKDAWLKWENDRHEILAGISPSPTFALVESIWNYRSVEKTPLDLQRLAGSRDFGLAAKGALDESERWNYHVMVGNGNSTGPETDEGKKMMLSLSYQLTGQWVVEAYGDWNSLADDTPRKTVQGFVGYESETVAFGALYAFQQTDNPIAGDTNLDIASAFVRAALAQGTTGLLRVDHMFAPNPDGENISYLPFSNEAESTLVVAGVDFQLSEDMISLIPNIEAVIYGETPDGMTPATDFIPRITLFYSF
ncbi:MAG: hypothetical protein WD317_06600 [Balneolaceae bacterium]